MKKEKKKRRRKRLELLKVGGTRGPPARCSAVADALGQRADRRGAEAIDERPQAVEETGRLKVPWRRAFEVCAAPGCDRRRRPSGFIAGLELRQSPGRRLKPAALSVAGRWAGNEVACLRRAPRRKRPDVLGLCSDSPMTGGRRFLGRGSTRIWFASLSGSPKSRLVGLGARAGASPGAPPGV